MDSSLKLLPYQRKGVQFLDAHDGRALIADDCGLGKTCQSLRWLLRNAETALPALVICPASLKLNWARETEKWTDLSYAILEGRQGPIPKTELLIVNYDVLANQARLNKKRKRVDVLVGRAEQLRKVGIQTVVIDEAHICKERTTKRTKAITKFCKHIPHVIALTGTPIVNRPAEFYPIINIINPDLFPNWWEFAKRYCDLHYDGFGWNMDGSSNTAELHSILTHPESGVMLRRLKSDVMTELPAKQRIVVPLQLPTDSQYWAAEADFGKWLEEQSTFKKSLLRPKFNTLKQLAALEKLPLATEWIGSYLEQGQKLVVFTMHHDTIDALAERLKQFKPLLMDGRTEMRARDALVQKFQTDPKRRLIMGHLLALGTGHTLTAASTTCFVELGWNGQDLIQGEDRVHRKGQTANSVFAYYLLASNTIEEDIMKLIVKKQLVTNNIIDGTTDSDFEVLHALFQKMKTRQSYSSER